MWCKTVKVKGEITGAQIKVFPHATECLEQKFTPDFTFHQKGYRSNSQDRWPFCTISNKKKYSHKRLLNPS